MKVAILPPDELQRLQALRNYNILDSETEKDFDEIVQLASTICEVPISLISLIDEHRQWFKSRIGLDVQETHRDLAFCAHAINQNDVMMVNDATKDDRFADNPLVAGNPDIRFYAGMPLITPDGFKLGTLCVVDRKPKTLTQDQIFSLQILAKQVVKQLELRSKVSELEKQKAALERLNKANSRLLSIIGHDLRSPIAMLTGLIQMSGESELSQAEFQNLIGQIESNLFSVNDLLANLFEWAVHQFEGRALKSEKILLDILVDKEVRKNLSVFKNKGNAIINNIDKNFPVYGDSHALSFIIRNLTLNANKFTDNGTITIEATSKIKEAHVTVTDTGVGMEQSFINKLFDGSFRTTSRGTNGEKGSGLGLPVCKEFIEKQGGKIWVKSTSGKGSVFSFSIPLLSEQ